MTTDFKYIMRQRAKKSGFWSILSDILLYIFFDIFWIIFLPLTFLIILIINLIKKHNANKPISVKTIRNKMKIRHK